MKRHDGVCAGCSTGCSITVEENQDHVYRLKPRENPHVNQWWMCDEGRYGSHHVHSRRAAARTRGAATRTSYVQRRVVARAAELDRREARGKAGRLAAVALAAPDGRRSVPAVQATFASIDPEAVLARWARFPSIGEDETFPERLYDPRREVPQSPRRRSGRSRTSAAGCRTWDDFLAAVDAGAIRRRLGHRRLPDAVDRRRRRPRSSRASKLLIVQDLFASPLWERADVSASRRRRSPSATARTSTTHDRLQSFHWAIRPPAGVQGRRTACTGSCWACAGLYNAAQRARRNRRARSRYFAAASGRDSATWRRSEGQPARDATA